MAYFLPRPLERWRLSNPGCWAQLALDSAGRVTDGWISMRGRLVRFAEFRSTEQIASEIQKLDIYDDSEKIIGGAFLETFDRRSLQHSWTTKGIWIQGRGVEAFGLQTKQNAGVIRARTGSEEAYEQLGMFMLDYNGERWLFGAANQTIKMI
jgi:hypothetical protein